MEETPHPHILKGLALREIMREKFALSVRAFSSVPVLVIIQVGDKEDSNIYIKHKIRFGQSIGVEVVHKKFNNTVTYEELKKEIEHINNDPVVTGCIVQLPLPTHIDRSILEHVTPKKDVDCLTEFHRVKSQEGDIHSFPATAKAVHALLQYYGVSVVGAHVVVVGRSKLAGGPIAELMKNMGARVSVIHSKTEHPEEISRTADILIVACGVPQLVTRAWVDPTRETVVVDVGIHNKNGKLVGDVDLLDVSFSVSAISPVPGGVGLLTVACLFEQLIYNKERCDILDRLKNN